MRIGKQKLAGLLAAQAGLTKKEAARAITGFQRVITSLARDGHTIILGGFGVFKSKTTDPKRFTFLGKPYISKPHRKLVFKQSPTMREKL